MEGNPNGQGEQRVAIVAELTIRLLDNGQVACTGPLENTRLMMLLCSGALNVAANYKPAGSPILMPNGPIPPVPPLRLLRNGK